MQLRVLVLDDDEGLTKTLTGMVEELGHVPFAASTAEEAFGLVERVGPVEVILADVRLPGLSGIEFLKAARAKHPDTHVILMTAYSDIDLAVMALETGAFGFLRKPFASKELEVMFRNVLSTRRLEQHNRALCKLLEGMEVINSRQPIDEGQLGRLLRVAIETTGSTSGSILVLDRRGAAVELAAAEGLPEDVVTEFRHDASVSVAGQVIRTGSAVILDGRLPEDSPFRRLMTRCDVTSAVCAPLMGEMRRVMGVLNLNRSGAMPLFDEADRGLAEIFAHAVALAVENGRLRDEQARSYESVQKMQRQLIQTEKLSSLGQLAAGIAHEINNPLTSVMGFAELLQRRIKDDGAVEFLGKIVTNAERIKRILLDLKDFYVPAKNRMANMDINRIIENAIPIARVHPEATGVTIQKHLTTPLPEVFCDENQILQVLINLFINAFQAMPEGGRVTVSSSQDGGFLVLQLADTGCGIPAEHLGRIFDPFFTTKSDWKGTGLGLSVCYTIVDNHGGTIEVDSTVGKGTTFTVRLPLSESRTETPSSEVEGAGRRGRILVVDDETDCRTLLRTVLTDLGFEVDEAQSGAVALERIRAGEAYRLVFLDYKMPDLNGAETYRRIHAIEPDLRVIVLTGSIGQSARMIVELGAQGFITKPFKVEEIERQLRKVLGRDWQD